MIEKEGQSTLMPKPFESDVQLLHQQEYLDKNNDELNVQNKYNGSPVFIQGEEYPSKDKWNLLIQLDSTNLPFYINFGDAGVGYGFINETEDSAKFIWQCT